MKNIKLTNLEKMNQEELGKIYGGRRWYIKIGTWHFDDGSSPHCLCIGSCSSSGESRRIEGTKDALDSSKEGSL